MKKVISLFAILFASFLLVSSFSLADEDMMVPAEQVYQGVHYMSGGIGLGERDAMLSVARNYTLKLVFAVKEGNFVSDVGVTIRNARGDTVLRAETDGPWLLAKLPRGNYAVSASYSEKTITRDIKVGDSLRQVQFIWNE